MKKIIRILGIKVAEIETLTPQEAERKELLSQHNPKGEVLEPNYEEENGNHKKTI
jgi:hypothetical protein